MKKNIIIGLFFLVPCCTNAQNLNRDSLSATAGKMYESVLPLLDRINFSGSSSSSQELKKRWNEVVAHLKNNKKSMADDVKNLLVSPSGKPIDMELLMKFIEISEQDSVKKININMDVIIDEIKSAAGKVTEAAKKMAESK